MAYLDMTNSSHQCPSGLRQRNDSNILTCVRNTNSSGCSVHAVRYSSANIQYSRVCGKVIGYQYMAPLTHLESVHGSNISSAYVDGVSLTHGDPREHIWTFAAAIAENYVRASSCRCIYNSAPLPPDFVGMDYFCDTGLQAFYTHNPPVLEFVFGDPLWDGEGCEGQNNCCSFNTPPWFYKQLPQPTTDDIEMRVCRDEVADNEDIAIEMIEIYVQ